MKTLVKEPGKEPYVKEIDGSLESLQEIVGGYIEVVPFTDDILCICNEEGKLMGLPFNFAFGWDDIVGTCCFVAEDGEDFGSLSDDNVEDILDYLS